MAELLIWIPLLPALAALVCGLLGPRVLKSWSHWPALIAMGATLIFFLYAWTLVRHGEVFERDFWTWMAAGEMEITFGLKLDALSCVMGLVVSFVGLLIFIYSIGYMHGDPGYGKYFSYVSLFAAMMYTLVLGNNLVVLFMGWEGVGLCSYLLIGFWYEDYEKASAAKKAFVVNRIGDAAFLIGMFLIWRYTGTLNFTELAHEFPGLIENALLPIGIVSAIALLLFIGATGKSAQIPLYTWLPDAMAGPTPVSALIHAATMVTAGIYMVTRCHFIFEYAPSIQTVIAIVGTATALVAAIIALTQNDIKKVLAYSTVSQLGYMFLALGCGAYVPAMFHLVTHAFFKACLFMISGNVIHGMGGEQDMRKMGGLRKDMPWSFYACCVSGAALAAIVPFAGFWSKDEIVGAAFKTGGLHSLLGVVGLIVGGLTAFYITRLICMTFLGKARNHHHAHEAPGSMLWPVLILAFFSLVGGYFNNPVSTPLHHFLGQVDAAGHGDHAEGPLAVVPHLEGAALYLLMFVATAIAVALVWFAYQAYVKKPGLAEKLAGSAGPLYGLSLNKFFVDEFYDKTAVAGTRAAAERSVWFDSNIIDGILHLIRDLVMASAELGRMFQSGQVQSYARMMILGIVLIIAIGLGAYYAAGLVIAVILIAFLGFCYGGGD